MGMKSMVDIPSDIRNDVEKNSEEQLVNDILLDMNMDVNMFHNELYDEVDDKPKPDVEFGLVEGMKCYGGVFDNKGGGVKCEGGAKFNMKKNDSIHVYMKLAQHLYDHMNEGYLLRINELMPS